MASIPGRGAQVRLDGDAQKLARGAGATRLVDSLEAKAALERAGVTASGYTPDGSTSTGQAAEDEILTPGAIPPGVQEAVEAAVATVGAVAVAKAGNLSDVTDPVAASGNLRVSATGTQVTRTLADKVRDVPASPKDYGWSTGVSDATAALRYLAENSPNDAWIPPGRFRISDMLTLPTRAACRGRSRINSTIVVDAGFNMSAQAVIRAGSSEPGVILEDFGIEFDQPVSTNRADYRRYPVAISAQGAPRSHFDRIRISGAWDGIDLTGNAGGSYLGRLEIGALGRGVIIDGSLDFVHGVSWHFWPFGFTQTAQLGVYRDGETVAFACGECDGLSVAMISTFGAKLVFASAPTGILSRNVGCVQLDGDSSRLVYAGRDLQIGTLYTTKGAATLPSIEVSGGRLFIADYHSIENNTAPNIRVTGGRLQIGKGFTNNTNADALVAEVTSGVLELNQLDLASANAARTVEMIRQSGVGVLLLRGSAITTEGLTGPVVSIGTDQARNYVVGNDFQKGTVTIPAASNKGTYGSNRQTAGSWLPELTFATPGDFSATYTVRQGRLWYEGNALRFDLRIVATTNAFTTAAGSVRIAGLPVPHGGIDSLGFAAGIWSGFDLGTGYTVMAAVISAGNSFMTLRQQGDNLASANLSTTNLKPSSTVEITVSGVIQL